ncbi:flavin reductase family protein [Sphingomonas endophytica]|uniref:Flavin reductase (DIM6/NTAB) family NADH-FMN oxidoreductase RutF n=1 Tax=Sphingomonas endophytica TaxID=869719 RepID=A0A7X0MPB0_9SPHN|nr:flavin reductase family protein [Sphingomonas endophytica]MBB5726008.1 flavin reductase (DIM6/NTAB) family NADH-FMN oxidoreductase RutF [Sphingomonas endophytica]MBB6506011.1 flavin reductase (DIM6/NTAB) family NADH-FMN oxidoreductase RutF [Sphingomonas endophytica]
MTEWHFYEPAQGHGLAHDPLNAIVGPRPIGWIATVSADGRRNLAPYSFFNLFSYRPPIIGFCSNGAKDSLANARETGEFVWNLATRDLAAAMNETSAMTDEDEFTRAGLAALPSERVAPPRVALSPVQFECKVTQIVQLQDRHGAGVPGWLVLGEAVAIHIDTAMLEDGVYQTARARPILRGGGPADYFELGETFAMTRPG